MNFETYIDQSLLRSESKIKRLCAPLQDYLDIPVFGYFSLRMDGSYCNVSNALKELEFYYGSGLYFNDPYLSNPSFFQSGFAIVQMTSDIECQETLQKKFGLNQFFQILYRREDGIEGFIFAQKNRNYGECLHFFEKIYLLEKFAQYFKKEAKTVLQDIRSQGYNMKDILKERFEAPDMIPSLTSSENHRLFLKKMNPLSTREDQCVNLYKQGHSAQSTAALLELSQRTVEHYLDNAKMKLGINSKREFLEF